MSEIYGIKGFPDGKFPISFNLIDRYQRGDSFLTEKLKFAKFKKGSFRGGRNTIELITYEGKIVIPQKLQKYLVKWYHTYLLHLGMDRTEVMVLQNLKWTGIRKSV